MEKKICSKCGAEKPVSDFTKRKNRKSGYYSSCKKCKVSYTKNKYAEDKINKPVELWISRNIPNTKYRAKKNKVYFDIDTNDLDFLLKEQSYKCVYCTNDLDFQGTSTNKSKSPTVDRLVPDNGYIKDNIVICCHRCNAIKNDATYEELINIGEKVKSLLENKH